MSGPKGISYQLSAEQRQALAVRNARARCSSLRDQVNMLLRDYAEINSDTAHYVTRMRNVVVPSSSNLDDYEQAEKDLTDLCTDISLAKTEARRRAATAGIGSLNLSIEVDFDITPATGHDAASHEVPTASRNRLPQLVKRLDRVTDQTARLALTQRIEEAVESHDLSENTVSAIESDLVDQLKREASEAELERQKAQLAAEFASLDSPMAQKLLKQAEEAESTAYLGHIRSQLRAVARAVAEAAEQNHVLAVAADALRDLGYDVTTHLGGVTAHSTTFSGRGIQLLAAPGNSLTSVPFASTPGSASDDIAFEHKSCGHLKEVVAKVATQGVHMTITGQIQPGQVPLARPLSADKLWQKNQRNLELRTMTRSQPEGESK